MRFFDGHCDAILRCYTEKTSLRENPQGHWDLKRAGEFEPSAQFFALFGDRSTALGKPFLRIFREEYDVFCLELNQNQERLALCRTKEQAEQAFSEGKTAAFLSVEGAELIDCSIPLLEEAYRMGVRAVNPTWNRANSLSGSVAEEADRGLSSQGKAFVQRMQCLGMLVDVSHLSDPGFWDVMEIAEKPIFASHSNARAVWPHRRNLTDEQFNALIHNGGVAGLNLYGNFLGENPDFDTLIAHLDHFWSLGGENFVSLGGDWDGCDSLPKGFENGIAGLKEFYEHLLRKNYSETLIEKLYFKNLMRVVGEVCTT